MSNFIMVPSLVISGIVNSLQADSNVQINGNVTLVSGANIALTQSGNSITIAATGELSQTLTNAHIFVGNGSNVATDVAMSGDATMANTGALTLANTAVTPASYTFTALTVDSKGRITAASSGTPITSIHADSNSNITGAARLVSGTNVTLTQSGQDITIAATGGGTSFPLQAPDGSAASPSYSFANQTNMGMYQASGDLRWATNGAVRLVLNTVFSCQVGIIIPDGTAGNPQLAFNSDSTTGLYKAGTHQLGFSSNSSPVFTVDSTNGIVLTAFGTNPTPLNVNGNFIHNVKDPTSAQDAATKNYVDSFASGANVHLSNLASVAINTALLGVDGSAAAPLYSFTNNSNTGMFNDGGAVGITATGLYGLQIDGNTTAGETRMWVFDVSSASLKRVSVGATDSGGSGFRVLRIPN